jgi:hypothetical protein
VAHPEHKPEPLTSTASLNDARRSAVEDLRDKEIVERTDGRELTIEVPAPGQPGEKMKITSKTLPSASMKYLRNVYEKSK